MSTDLCYVLLVFGLFVVPRLLVRLRLPPAITSLLLGAAIIPWAPFAGDRTLPALATVGIVALFLSAGLEVELGELRRRGRAIALVLAVFALLLALAAYAAAAAFELAPRPALLVALALTTPSTGFILDSLPSFDLEEEDRRAVKDYAIGTELLALLVLFCTVQSEDAGHFALSTLALVVLVFAIPLAFRLFAAHIAPHAPRTEFAFLIMVAVLSAFLTRELGVYYLVGAFVVGLIARRFRDQLPALSSQRILHAVEDFGLVFSPFYFFQAGTSLGDLEFGWRAALLGAGLLAVCVPLRMFAVALAVGRAGRLAFGRSRGMALANIPTLVFSLVLVKILHEGSLAPPELLGGIVIYTVGNTLIAGFVLARGGTPVAPGGDVGAKLERPGV